MQVVALARYPVKSMQGEALGRAEITDLGIVGDRQWALVDMVTGLALTARRAPDLLFARARLIGPEHVEVELPDGTVATDDGALSSWLGRTVTLRRAVEGSAGTYEIAADFEDEAGSDWVRWQGPDGTFHDSTRTRVSLLSTTTMGDWDQRRFRANIVVDARSPGEEDDLIGRRIEVGSAVLDVVMPIERCVMTTRPQPGGIERDLDVLRTIHAERANMLGVGAMVARSGTVSVGDVVHPHAPS